LLELTPRLLVWTSTHQCTMKDGWYVGQETDFCWVRVP
jgi:hypothetical protein